MKSGEEKMSFMLTRSEIEEIIEAFEGFAGEFGKGGSVEKVKEFYNPVAGQVYERMLASLELMNYLEDPDGN